MNSNTYAMMKAFFCAGLESGIRLSTPARGYDNKNEKMSFTAHYQLIWHQPNSTDTYAHLVLRPVCQPRRQTLQAHVSKAILRSSGARVRVLLTGVDV